MKIERDSAQVTGGVRHGRTLGGPVALQIANRDYANWEERMSPWPGSEEVDQVHLPRPGHADLVGTQKYKQSDVRNILERASARETAARVAGGAVLKALLRALGVSIYSHVIQIGSVSRARARSARSRRRTSRRSTSSPVRCLDAEASRAMVREIDDAAHGPTSRSAGSSRCSAFGLLPGVGSHVSWEQRLDGRLGMAICSIQAIKGFSLGDAFTLAGLPGSQAHDEIFYSAERGYFRETNRAGRPGGGDDERRSR